MLRGPPRRPRRRAGPRPRHPVGPLARGAAARPSPTTTSPRSASSPASAEDRGPTARRAEEPARRRPTSTSAAVGGWRRTATATVRRRRRRVEVREALAGLGYGPDEVREALGALPDDAPDDAGALLRLALRSLAGGAVAAVRDELLEPEPLPDEAEADGHEEVGAAAARDSPSSSARPELKEHLGIMLEAARPPRPGRRPPPVRRTARPRARRPWPASSPPSWACACTSRRGRPSNGPATSPPSSPTSTTATSSSSTRSTASPRAVEEVLYPAMEDFQLDIVLGKGPAARSIRLDLPRFTLVGATTRTGLITGPLRDRFGLVARLDYYEADRPRGASSCGPPASSACEATAAGAREIARRARGTPAHRQPAAAPRARLRRGPGRRHRRRGGGAGQGLACSASTSSASTRSTGPCSRRAVRAVRRRPRRAQDPRHQRRASRRRPSRTSTSRSSSSRACCCARRGAGWPPRRPGPTSAWPRPVPTGGETSLFG